MLPMSETPDPAPAAPRPETDLALFAERDRAQEVCSLLLANGYAPTADFRDLLYDEELRQRVERRLQSVGMKLLYNVHGDHWGVGLNDNTAADDRLEWSNNLGLERGALALLLVLWCKLILPKRLEQESTAEQKGLLSAAFAEYLASPPPPAASIGRDQIVAEFGQLLGGVTNTSKYLAQLSRAKLIKTYGGVIEEGPLLALVIDEAGLGDQLRREVLISTLRRQQQVRQATAADPQTTATAAPAAGAATDDDDHV
jgi:hypothetical protein